MGFENVGRVWTPESLEQYLAVLPRPDWCRSITLHHCGAPSLAQRPAGLTVRHIENIRDFYQSKSWRSGPHLFVDDDQIFGMSDFRRRGVHAVSFNASSIGIEVLGDYDQEDPHTGRGLACWQTAAAASRILLDWLGIEPSEQTVHFHRDDPKTTKSCPGRKVTKEWVLSLIAATAVRPAITTDKPDVGLPWQEWEFRREQWCVPVLNFLVAKGVPIGEVIASLSSRNGDFYYGTELLEGAYYVAPGSAAVPNGCTWAPVRELLDLVPG
jgi:hypothetical protein